jgi:hypothetical protein
MKSFKELMDKAINGDPSQKVKDTLKKKYEIAKKYVKEDEERLESDIIDIANGRSEYFSVCSLAYLEKEKELLKLTAKLYKDLFDEEIE